MPDPLTVLSSFGQLSDQGANWRLKFADADGLPLNMASFERIDFGAISFKEIFQNVKVILSTILYSAPLERLLGIDQTIVDRPIVDASHATVAILSALTFWENRVQVLDVTFAADVINGHLIPTIQLNINNVIYGTDTLYDRNAIPLPPEGTTGMPTVGTPPPPSPSPIPDPLQINTLLIGKAARLVALPNGVKLEVWDGTNWIEQIEYTEGSTIGGD